MGRKNRYAPPGITQHVNNRGNDRRRTFLEPFDYIAFMELLSEAARQFAVRIFGYCLMPNHFHLLIQPLLERELSAFMERLTGRYACTFRRQTGTVGHGHVFQRRFWNAAAQDEAAFLAILRYIEANPVRACLVSEADLWPYSSFTERRNGGRRILSPLPMPLPPGWSALVNTPQSSELIAKIRKDLIPVPGRPKAERAADANREGIGDSVPG